MLVRNKPSVIRLVILQSLLFISSIILGQVRDYRINEKVSISPNEYLQILRCKGEAEKKVCEVIYFVNNKRVGSPFWLTTSAIYKKEKGAKKDIQKPVTKIATIIQKPSAKTKPPQQSTSDKIPPSQKHFDEKQKTTEPNQFANQLEKALNGRVIGKHIDSVQKTENKKGNSILKGELPGDANQKTNSTDIVKQQINATDTILNRSGNSSGRPKKLGVFIDCRSCDMNYIRSNLSIVDFLLDRNAADVHALINEQSTGGGGKSVQMIFYGQNKFRSIQDTVNVNLLPTATAFEKRTDILNSIKLALVPFISKTPYSKFLTVNIADVETGKTSSIIPVKDPWNYWTFRVGTDGSINSDQVYKSTELRSYISAYRTTDKIKIGFSGSGNYNNYKYNYSDNGVTTEYEVLNRDYAAEHSLIASLGSHWGIGYLGSFSNSTFSNNKSRLYGKAALEYSIFPYKDINTRFITLSYGVDVRANNYYDTTIYFKTEEVLYGHVAQALMAFNQKWGTLTSTLTYRSYLNDLSLNNISARMSLNIRITGGLSFYFYTSGSRVRDQVYLVKGKATQQDVLTRRRQLASEYNLYNGMGISLRFGSKLNNYVNPRLENL